MNLISCAHPCIHQKDGYCTLQQLNRADAGMHTDCIYYAPGSSEQAAQFPHLPHGGQL